jgi:hypothetical protein
MLGYVVVGLVAAMVVAPVLWIMPTPRQRRQERMRARARALGIDVRIGELPQTRRARVRRESPRQGAAYRLAGNGARTGLRSTLVCRDNPSSPWQLESGDEAPAELLAPLAAFTGAAPADVAALELNPLAPTAFWRESGDEENVERLAAALAALRDALQEIAAVPPAAAPD